jgi:hypothetical protein
MFSCGWLPPIGVTDAALTRRWATIAFGPVDTDRRLGAYQMSTRMLQLASLKSWEAMIGDCGWDLLTGQGTDRHRQIGDLIGGSAREDVPM